MYRLKIISVFQIFLLCISLQTALAKTNFVDEYFDSYGDVTWEKEKNYLDNFAVALKEDVDLIGYIAFYVGKENCLDEIESRVNRAVSYLVNKRKIQRSRIITIHAGYAEKLKIILQPVEKNAPKLNFPDTENVSNSKDTKKCLNKSSTKGKTGSNKKT